MGIDRRQSGVVLSIAAIRDKITDFDIFSYYCPPFKHVGTKFSSELREDPRPSAIISPVRGNLRYKDFGYEEHAFDSIGYVLHKYNLTFLEAMQMINNDFGLGLSMKRSTFTQNQMAISKGKREFKAIPAQFKIRSKSFGWLDNLYWDEFLVEKETTEWFHVKPIDFYWINDTRFKAHKICYAYMEHAPRIKIYSPLKAEGKWWGNMKVHNLQGYSSLLPFGKRLYITSSLKDVMVLFEINEVAVAPQTESSMVSEKIMKHLMSRFDEVIILYDNDYDKEENPGQKMAKMMSEKYGLKNICIPTELESKDPAALMAAHGPVTLKRILRDEIKVF